MAKKFVRNLKTEQEYVLSGQLGEENLSKVYFLPLNKEEVMAYQGRQTSISLHDDGNRLHTHNAKINYEIVLKKLTNWENFLDEDGKEISFEKDSTGTIKKELLDEVLDVDTINEIGHVIMEVSSFPDKAKIFLGK
jgi:hypothetical protein